MDSIRKTIETLWRELVDSRFSEDDFICAVMLDCGHDAAGVSETDFRKMLNTGSCAVMQEMAWCCNEVLAYYLADALGSAQFVRAIFIALCGVRTIELGVGNWDFMFDKICMLLVQNMARTDYQFRMRFLKSILCQDSEPARTGSTP